MSSDISLDSLNAKQLLKEYKTVAKSIKNKDDDVKRAALDKLLYDSRYMIDGGCVLPLLEIIQPKKKTLDFSLVALQNLLAFLTPKSEAEKEAAAESTGHVSTNPALDIIQTVYKLSNESDTTKAPNLNEFQVIADLIVYHDEVKKVKAVKVKKGEVAPPVPKIYDSELSIALRNGSLNVLYLLVQALLHDETGLASALAQVPGITTKLCSMLCTSAKILIPSGAEPSKEEHLPPVVSAEETEGDEADMPVIEEPTEEDLQRTANLHSAAMQETEWALASLALLLKHSPDACQILLASPALGHMPGFSVVNKSFVQPVLQVLSALAHRCDVPEGHISGLSTIAQPQYWNILLDVAGTATDALVAAPIEDSPNAAAGDEEEDAQPKQLDRELLYLQTVVKTFTHVAQEQERKASIIKKQQQQEVEGVSGATADIITAENVQSLLKCIYSTVSKPSVWALASATESLGGLSTFADDVCIMLGSICLASPELRVCVCATGGVGVLLNVLLNSTKINANAYISLRRVAEQALFRMLTKPEVCVKRRSCWDSCINHTTDEHYFAGIVPTKDVTEGGEEENAGASATGETFAEEFHRLMQTLLVDRTNNNSDHGENEIDTDLSDRAARILFGIVASSVDNVIFIKDILNINPTMTKSIAVLGNNRAKSLVTTSLEHGEAVDTNTLNVTNSDLLKITADESFYIYMSLLDILFCVSTEHTKAFSDTEENIRQLSDIIFACGPTCHDDTIKEKVIYLYDPRQSVIRGVPLGPQPAVGEQKLLRPLILNVLANLSEQDMKLQREQGKGGSDATSALAVSKLCADACVATLSVDVVHSVHEIEHTICVQSIQLDSSKNIVGTRLDTDVLNSSIRCLHSMATCGSSGILTVLSALASPDAHGAASKFKNSLGEATYNEVNIDNSSASAFVEGEGEDEQSSSPPVSVRELWESSNQEKWEPPSKFSDIIVGNGNVLPNTVVSLAQRPVVWPFISLLSPLVHILGNPQYSTTSADLAANAIISFCCQTLHHVDAENNDTQQDMLFDICDAVFVGLGGTVALLSAASLFGKMSEKVRINACIFANFLAGRGSVYPVIEPVEAQEDEEQTEQEVLSSDGLEPVIWRRLLDIWSDDLHQKEKDSTALLTAIRGGLPEQAVALISNGVDVNKSDSGTHKITPLMFALVMGQETVVNALIKSGADVNALDGAGSPAIKYAFATINKIGIQSIITAASAASSTSRVAAVPSSSSKSTRGYLKFYGASTYVELLVEAGADLLANDSPDTQDGNSAVHYCLGLGHSDVFIGGQACKIIPGAYADEDIVPLTEICDTMKLLLSKGNVNANQCNNKLIVPLHVAAARGHINLIKLLHSHGASPNVRDMYGFLPLHHIACCCPLTINEALDLILKLGEHAPTKDISYDRVRGSELNDVESKRNYDVDQVLEDIFRQATAPPSLVLTRNTYEDLATSVTSVGNYNILHLLLAGHVLQEGTCWSLALLDSQCKQRRLAAAVNLLTKWKNIGEKGTGTDVTVRIAQNLINGDCSNNSNGSSHSAVFNIYHAVSLLLQGQTPRIELNEAQKRSKRVKTYESLEIHLLDLLHITTTSTDENNDSGTGDIYSRCTHTVPGFCNGILGTVPSGWTPFHAHLAGNNTDRLNSALSILVKNVEILPECIDMMTRKESSVNVECATLVINSYIKEVIKLRPNILNQACQNGNVAIIQAVLACERIDVNNIDESSGDTAFTAIVKRGMSAALGSEERSAHWKLLELFQSARHRLDLFAGSGSNSEYNAIDCALRSLDSTLFTLLITFRKNDVFEKVCISHANDETRSWLLVLEEENITMANTLNAPPAVLAELAAAAAAAATDFLPAAQEGDSESVASPEATAAADTVTEAGISESKDQAMEDEENTKEKPEDGKAITIPATNINKSPTNEERKDITHKLTASNNILQTLFLNGLVDIVTEDCHAHACFHKRQLYTDFLVQPYYSRPATATLTAAATD